jgi:hypothetical protein
VRPIHLSLHAGRDPALYRLNDAAGEFAVSLNICPTDYPINTVVARDGKNELGPDALGSHPGLVEEEGKGGAGDVQRAGRERR